MNLEKILKKAPQDIRDKFSNAISLFSKAKQFTQKNKWNDALIYARYAKEDVDNVATDLAKAFGGAEKVPKEIRMSLLNLIKDIEKLKDFSMTKIVKETEKKIEEIKKKHKI